jgi:hypothetical protein
VLGSLLAAGQTINSSRAATDATLNTQSASIEAVVETGRLQAKESGSANGDIAGSMSSPSGAMSFHTSSFKAGIPTRAGVLPDRVVARLEVNGAVITHEMNYSNNTITIRTDVPVTIDQSDRNVLKTFQSELGRGIQASGGLDNRSKAQELLWRLSEMYSEIPLGMKLPPVRVIRKDDKGTDNAMVLPTTGAPATNPLGIQVQPTADNLLTAASSCVEKDGGGFIDLHARADVCDNDRVLYRSTEHDYCPAHGYISSNVAYGCGSDSCAGRCGSGCGLDGRGAWYKDCLDHDICNRAHGSQLGGCGDEWIEAAEDYLYGAISCTFLGCH